MVSRRMAVGRGTPCSLKYRPHALHTISPRASRRQIVVVCVPQLLHDSSTRGPDRAPPTLVFDDASIGSWFSEAGCPQGGVGTGGSCCGGCARAGKLCFLRAVPATFAPRPELCHSPFGETAPLGVCCNVAESGDVDARSGDTVIPRCLLFINRLSSCVASPPRPAHSKQVLVILCVLVSASCALKADVKNAPCDVSLQDDNSYTVNCSRRNMDRIPSWPQQINDIDKDSHVRITFFNNSLTNVTQLPSVPGTRVALIFKFNKIVEIEDDAFRNIDQLVYLDLSNNRISGDVLRSEIFQGPYNDGVYSNIALETLNLGNNQIHSLDRYLFKYTPNLTRLYLNNNPIEILDHVTILALSSATDLEVLDLSKTDIDNIPLDAFRGLVNLQQIDLSNNKFTTVPESLSLVGSTLEYLTINNNPISELNDDSFINLTNLKQLEVGENDYLEEVKRSTFSPLKQLRVLHLCHNRNLRYISHNAFRGLKDNWTLKEVYLDNNKLSELSTDLMPWKKLDILGMAGNNWLCNCDLANIVTDQGAGTKFKTDEIPHCAAPMRLSGAYITNITVTFCPTFDTTFTSTKSFSLSDLKPKHILWSILGVAMIACLGMLLGLLVNAAKAFYKKKIRTEPIRYLNLNNDSSFA